MIADMQRARHLAWELPKLGWEVEILCPDESYQRSPYVDKDSSLFFSPTTGIHFVKAYYSAIFSTIGIGSIGWRAFIPMLRAGRKLLKRRRFDLIYFSTTQFPLFLLGPIWQRWFGIPYVLDFQDPLYREGNTHPVWTKPTIKHAIASCLGKYVEFLAHAVCIRHHFCFTKLLPNTAPPLQVKRTSLAGGGSGSGDSVRSVFL